MDKEDWIIVLAPGIIFQFIVWSSLSDGGVRSMNILGVEVDPVVVGSVITGLFLVVGILIKHLLYDKKQYKHLLRQLGDFNKRSLSSLIGEADEKSLIKQHQDILSMLSKDGLLADKINSISEILTSTNEKQSKRYQKFKKMNKSVAETLLDLQYFFEDWEQLSAKVETLTQENNRLSLSEQQYTNEITILNQKLQTIQRENDSSKMDNDSSEIIQLKSDLSDMSKQLAHKDYELERLSSEIDRLQEDDNELER